MSFEKLLQELEELETLGKSQSADDAADDDKIQAAADEGNADTDGDGKNDVTGEDTGDDGGDDGDDGDDDEEEDMGKSFSFKLDDGTEVEAVDGTQMVKALMTRVEKSEGQTTEALERTIGLLKSQGEIIKSLQGQVEKLASSGKGRKTVLSIAEKKSVSEMRKSETGEGDEDGMPAQEFMAKALSAQSQGKVTGADVARAESYINRGLQVPEDIVKRVISQ